MQQPQNLPDVLEALLDQVQQLHMANTVQNAAFVALARHLAVQGHADLPTLANDLDTLTQVQRESGWKSGLQALATSLRFSDRRPSGGLQ